VDSPSQEGNMAQALALRARIVLFSAEGPSNTEIARRVHVSLGTVGSPWCKAGFLRKKIG
jgi:DNA-binding NarL/FixJ family response regulator